VSAVSCWNFAQAFYQLGEGPTADKPALIHGDESISYRELRRRSLGIASYLAALGLEPGAHVGHYMRNSNAYLETFSGAALAGFSHLNVNYRYQDDELVDLCNGLDIQVLVYDSAFADRVASIRPRLEKVRCFICADGEGEDPALASLYDHPPGGFQPRASGEDLMLIATGGTTGLPKGVQWRHEDVWFKQDVSMGIGMAPLGLEEAPLDMAAHVANVSRLPQGPPFLVLSPLMHATGLLISIMLLAQGVPVITLPGEHFDPEQTLQAIKEQGVGSMVLVGDAFALPLVEVLDKRAGEGLIDSLLMIISSGAAMSNSCRDALLRHRQGLFILDTLGSSEASGYAMCTPEAGVFQPMPTTRVLDEQLRDIEPGSDSIGIAYVGGFLPRGYYNEPEKTAETFLTIDGERYVCTGDRCTVREDGMLELLGRDSTVINSGGEKIYTVEVERVLLEHPDISDVVVVGLPHPRFGKQVAAVVEGPKLSRETLDADSFKAYAAEKLAGYKVPRLIYAVDSLRRAANGKPDYDFVTGYAETCLAADSE
jgi:3-oxocholest-4-en-26-oate---CoA ligase